MPERRGDGIRDRRHRGRRQVQAQEPDEQQDRVDQLVDPGECGREPVELDEADRAPVDREAELDVRPADVHPEDRAPLQAGGGGPAHAGDAEARTRHRARDGRRITGRRPVRFEAEGPGRAPRAELPPTDAAIRSATLTARP